MSRLPDPVPCALERLDDQRDAASALRARAETADEERLPWAMVKRLSAGESPVLVWREHRGLTCAALAAASGISETVAADVEAGRHPAALQPLMAIARALRVDLDELVSWAQE